MGRILLVTAIALAFACGTRAPISMWYYSSWHGKMGGRGEGAFERDRQACLEQVGIAQNPDAIEPNGSEEDRYVMCMNEAGWCTNAYNCAKSGAS